MKLEKALKSKALYYVALVLMVVNVLGYVSVGSVECIIVFAITYYLSNSYTKNQSLDILIGLFAANVVFGCGRVREGFEEGNASKAADKATVALTQKAKEKGHESKCNPNDPTCAAKAKALQVAAGKASEAATLAKAAAAK